MADNCVDCGAPKPEMHNNREVKLGLFGRKTETKRFPGYLCIECWKAANPNVWPNFLLEPKRKRNWPFIMVWSGIFIYLLAVVIALVVWAYRPAIAVRDSVVETINSQ